MAARQRLTMADVVHTLFVSVATVVMLGWLVRLVAGDPLDLLRALPRGVSFDGAFGRTVDLLAVLVIAGAGCRLAHDCRRLNVAAEGQLIFGYAVACWVGASLSSFNSLVIVVFVALAAAAFIGALCASITFSPAADASVGDDAAAGLLFNAIIAATVAGWTMRPRQLLFPLFEGRVAPRGGLVLAVFVFLAFHYARQYLPAGMRWRAATPTSRDRHRRRACLASGALCALAGAVMALSGYGPGHGQWGPEGIGYLAFAIAVAVRAGLQPFFPLVALAAAALHSGWSHGARAGLPVVTMAVCLLAAHSFLNLEEDGGAGEC